jgi:polar amino acid transport system substrate-binding protein
MRTLLLVVGLFLCAGGISVSAQDVDTLVLTTPAGPPLSMQNQQGFIDLVVSAALARMGYQLKVSHLPAERALINANNGVDDGDLNRIGGLEKFYPNLIQVPEQTFDMEFAAFAKNVTFSTTDWNTLKPYTVAIINGWKILERSIPPEVTLTKVKNSEQLFNLLEKDRVDVILYGKWQGLHYIREHKYNNVKLLQPSLAKMNMYVYFNKKHRDLAHEFSKKLREMKADGTYQNIYNRVLTPLTQ